MPFDGIPPHPTPPTLLVDHMLCLLATRDNWLRSKEKELGEDGVLRVCLLGAFKLSAHQLPQPMRRSAKRIVQQTLNQVICDMTQPTFHRRIKRLTRLRILNKSLMVAFNDDERTSYYDVITILHKTRARVRLATSPVLVTA